MHEKSTVHPGKENEETSSRSVENCGCVLWLTGLPGSGKSTLAAGVVRELRETGIRAFNLDGDDLRRGLCSDLEFSPDDRAENIRRAGEVAALMAGTGLVVVCSLISPYAAGRKQARECCERNGIRFAEVFVDAPVEVCRERDPRGLYRKALAGEIRDFTGVSAPYETPSSPDLTIQTAGTPQEESIMQLHALALRIARQPSRSAGATILSIP